VRGYYDLLDQHLARAVEERFVRAEHRSLIAMAEAPAALLDKLQAAEPRHVDKWLDRSER
jgi:hypothetical protein